MSRVWCELSWKLKYKVQLEETSGEWNFDVLGRRGVDIFDMVKRQKHDCPCGFPPGSWVSSHFPETLAVDCWIAEWPLGINEYLKWLLETIFLFSPCWRCRSSAGKWLLLLKSFLLTCLCPEGLTALGQRSTTRSQFRMSVLSVKHDWMTYPPIKHHWNKLRQVLRTQVFNKLVWGWRRLSVWSDGHKSAGLSLLFIFYL